MDVYVKMSDSLNYELDSTEERIELVSEILKKNEKMLVDYYSEYYNPHISQDGLLSEDSRMGKNLESLATYLLNSKDENEESNIEIITDYKKKRNATREANIENLMKVSDFKKSDNNKSIIKVPKIKVNKEDRLEQIGRASCRERV